MSLHRAVLSGTVVVRAHANCCIHSRMRASTHLPVLSVLSFQPATTTSTPHSTPHPLPRCKPACAALATSSMIECDASSPRAWCSPFDSAYIASNRYYFIFKDLCYLTCIRVSACNSILIVWSPNAMRGKGTGIADKIPLCSSDVVETHT